MPINEYDSPLVVQPIQTYVSQHVKLPYAELQGALDRRQQSYDVGEATHNALGDAFAKVGALNKDKELRNERLNEYNNSIESSLETYQGDYSKMHGSLNKIGRSFKREMTQGQLGAIHTSFANAQDYSKYLAEKVKDGFISQKTSSGLEKWSMDNYKGVQRDIQANGIYNTFNGIAPSKEIDVAKLTDEYVKGWLANSYGAENVRPSGDGRYLVKIGNSWEEANYNEIYSATEAMLYNNPDALPHLIQKHNLINHVNPTHDIKKGIENEIKQSAHFGASKYGYRKEESTMDVKEDPYTLMLFGKNLDKPVPAEQITKVDTHVEVDNPLGKDEEEINSNYRNNLTTVKTTMNDLFASAKVASSGNPTMLKSIESLEKEFKEDPNGFMLRLDKGEVGLPTSDIALIQKLEVAKNANRQANLTKQLINEAEEYAAKKLGFNSLQEAKVANYNELKGKIRTPTLSAVIKGEEPVQYIEKEIFTLKDLSGKPFKVHGSVITYGSAGIKMKGGSKIEENEGIYTITTPQGTYKTTEVPYYKELKEHFSGQTVFSSNFVSSTKFNNAKKEYLESKSKSIPAGTSSTGIVIRDFNPVTRQFTVNADATKNANDVANDFFKTKSGEVNLANVGNLEAYVTAGGEKNNGSIDELIMQEARELEGLTFNDKSSGIKAMAGTLRYSDSNNLKGKGYITLPVSFVDKNGRTVKIKDYYIPSDQLQSTSLSHIFNTPIMRARSAYNADKLTGVNKSYPLPEFPNMYFVHSENGDDKRNYAVINGKRYTTDEGINELATVYAMRDRQPVSRTSQANTGGFYSNKADMSAEQFNNMLSTQQAELRRMGDIKVQYNDGSIKTYTSKDIENKLAMYPQVITDPNNGTVKALPK